MKHYSKGLDGVIATETTVSFLDTAEEQIVIRGYDLLKLSQYFSYIDVVYLLLEGELPTPIEKKTTDEILRVRYSVPEEIYDMLMLMPRTMHPMDGLRTALSMLAGYDLHINDHSQEAELKLAYELVAKMPNLVANSYRILNGQPIIEPDESLSYTENFYHMITGRIPTKIEAHIFDQSLTLYSEHEMPNSTFAARVIASTNCDMYGALTGAVSSLKGNLHGGANEAVMYMLLEGETVEGFEKLIREKLAQKEKIMGFGHRVYMNKMDPRARMMKEALKTLCMKKGEMRLYHMCIAGERIMAEEKQIYPNLDYYAAPVYYLLGLPIEMYTPIFFAARTIGLCAHVMEQHANNRLFRPRVAYEGPRRSFREAL